MTSHRGHPAMRLAFLPLLLWSALVAILMLLLPIIVSMRSPLTTGDETEHLVDWDNMNRDGVDVMCGGSGGAQAAGNGAADAARCPADCRLSDWGPCSVACGGGTQARTVAHEATNGGRPCPADAPMQRACNEAVCDADCAVGDWSACSEPCGGGSQSRKVARPQAGGGAACPALTQRCNLKPCPTAAAAGQLRSRFGFPSGQEWSSGVSRGGEGSWDIASFYEGVTRLRSSIVENRGGVDAWLTAEPPTSFRLRSGGARTGTVKVRMDALNDSTGQSAFMFISISV